MWLVELAPVAEPEPVAGTVAAVLGVREDPGRPMHNTLVDTVGDRYLLVVLDNAEHVIDAVAKLADAVMRSCPRAYLLVTSREPLGISGEHVFRVPSLTVPRRGRRGAAGRFRVAALFVERARTSGTASLSPRQRRPGRGHLFRLDGIPLAIELAAAGWFDVGVRINYRLDQRFRLLTGGSRTALPRHQTLSALIDWSYDLLNPAEQLVLDRLSVFAGGWTWRPPKR